MSCLTVVQRTCQRLGLSVPAAVVTSTDQQVLQMLALLNEEGEELSERYPWSVMDLEATFTTVATPADMVTVAPGFKYLINDTMWDRTENTRIVPINAREWQQVLSGNVAGAYTRFRIWQGAIYFYPDLAAGHDIAFEYQSKNWVLLASDGSTASAFAADADVALLDEAIMTMGLIWRFKQAKGFAYDEDFNKYERRVMDAMGRDGSKQRLDAGGTDRQLAITIPEGNWPLP